MAGSLNRADDNRWTMNHREIADALGSSANMVRMAERRAIRKLWQDKSLKRKARPDLLSEMVA